MTEPHRINFSRNRRTELHALLEGALRQRIFPGVELLVARGDEVLLHETWGQLEVGPEAKPLQRGTLFDIASITKPVATATSFMVLLETGQIGLEDKVSDYFPEYDTPEKAGVTLRHLLTHTAGLPDTVALHSETDNRADALQRLLRVPLKHPTGAAMVYSDLGFMILAELIRRISGRSLSALFRQYVSHPLQLRHTLFNPLEEDVHLPIAPTQFSPTRNQLLRGSVHDENAFLMGGEGGHAGLFSTAADLHRYARAILGGGELEGVRILSPRTVQVMVGNHNPRRLAPRGLGWDIKGEGFGYMSCGELMRAGSFGHTGFTGTSLWVEPESRLVVICLTNRVYMAPEKNQADMMRFRARLHNILVAMFADPTD